MAIGCVAVISGYVRLKYSVVIIMLEICQDMGLFLPMMVAVITSNHVGLQFTRGVYHRLVRTKQCPVLTDSIPHANLRLKADYIMNPNLVTFHAVESVENIQKHLVDSFRQHRAFPIQNEQHHLVGMIPRNFLIVLLRQKNFYYKKDK